MNYLKLALLVFISACTLTPDLQVNEYVKEMKTKILKDELFIKNSATEIFSHEQILKKAPSNAGKTALDKMIQSRVNMLQFFYRFKEDFRGSPLQEMITVKSNDVNYANTKSMMDQFDKGHLILEGQMNNYALATKELESELAKKKIYLVDGEELNKIFLENLNFAKKRVIDLKNELIEYSVKNDPKTKQAIADMSVMIEKMENETFSYQRLYTASMKEVGRIKKFATPGMKTYNWQQKQSDFLDKLEELDKQFKNKALTLN